MENLFENFAMWVVESVDEPDSYMVACRDREAATEERWVVACITEAEAKQLYESLHRYFG